MPGFSLNPGTRRSLVVIAHTSLSYAAALGAIVSVGIGAAIANSNNHNTGGDHDHPVSD